MPHDLGIRNADEHFLGLVLPSSARAPRFTGFRKRTYSLQSMFMPSMSFLKVVCTAGRVLPGFVQASVSIPFPVFVRTKQHITEIGGAYAVSAQIARFQGPFAAFATLMVRGLEVVRR